MIDMEKEYIVGMDGGGTGTNIQAYGRNHSSLGEWKVGPLNINGQSYEKTAETVRNAIHMVRQSGLSIEDCKGICIGAAGISNKDTASVITQALQEEGVKGKIKLVGDHETALAAAFPDMWGIILISGTGSICYGRDRYGTRYRVGGYGHIIDDDGSAYAIGRDILRAVALEYDGREEATSLKEAVFDRLGLSSMEELITWLYSPERTKKEIAALAPLAEAEEERDSAAARIIEKASRELSTMAATMLCKLPEAEKIVLGGSVFLKNQRIRERFIEHIGRSYPQIQIENMSENAAVGAVRIIKEELGW